MNDVTGAESRPFRIAACVITVLSISVWCVEWWILVGFNQLRTTFALWVPMAVFLVASFFNLAVVIGATSRRSLFSTGSDPEAMGLSGAAVLAALSLFATLAGIPEATLPTLRIRFHWTIVLAFLWIAFGVLSGPDIGDGQDSGSDLAAGLRFFKATSLLHAMGWATTSGVLIAMALDRAARG